MAAILSRPQCVKAQQLQKLNAYRGIYQLGVELDWDTGKNHTTDLTYICEIQKWMCSSMMIICDTIIYLLHVVIWSALFFTRPSLSDLKPHAKI